METMIHQPANSPDTTIIYRQAVSSDAVKLSVLYTQCYIHAYAVDGVSDEYANYVSKQFAAERILQTVTDQPGNILVAEYQNNLVGVAEIAFGQKCPLGELVAAELSKLYVLQWFGGKGIGHHLLKAGEDLVHSRGEDKLWLWAWDQNPRAIAFYQREGYQIVGPTPCPMEQNMYTNIVMTKDLVSDGEFNDSLPGINKNVL